MTVNSFLVQAPIEITNLVKNPIAGGPSSFSAVGTATITRINDLTLFGVWSYRVQTAAQGDGIRLQLAEAIDTTENYIFTFYTRPYTTGQPLISSAEISSAGTTTPGVMGTPFTVDGVWWLQFLEFDGADHGGATSTYIDLLNDNTGANAIRDVVVTGFLLELEKFDVPFQAYGSPTFGGWEGAYWLGEEHNSASRRDRSVSNQGTTYALGSYSGFTAVPSLKGLGAAPVINASHQLALFDGEVFTNQTKEARRMSIGLRGDFDNQTEVLTARENLIRLFATTQPVRLWYGGKLADAANSTKIIFKGIDCVYEGGLDMKAAGASDSNLVTKDDLVLDLVAFDPSWFGFGEKSKKLSVFSNSFGAAKVGLFLNRSGQWGLYDGTSTVTAKTTDGTGSDGPYHWMVCDAKNGEFLVGIYSGQNDTTAQLNNAELWHWKPTDLEGAAGQWENITRISTRAFTHGSTPAGTDVNPWSQVLFANKADTAYIASAQNQAGAGSDASVYEVTLSSESFTDLGDFNGSVKLFQSRDGDLWAFGSFTEIDSVSKRRLVYWDGSSWTEVASLTAGTVTAVGEAPNGDIIFSLSDASLDYLRRWDGSSSSAVTADGLDDAEADAILVDDAGTIFLFGDFTTSGSADMRRAAMVVGETMIEMGGGLNGAVNGASWYNEEKTQIVVWGSFTKTADGATDLPDRVAIWTGDEFVPYENYWGSTPTDFAHDPKSGNAIAVFDQSSVSGPYGPGLTEVDYGGSSDSYLRFRIENNSSADTRLDFLGVKETGARIPLYYLLQPDEVLTVNFEPGKYSVESSFYGSLWSIVKSSADLDRMFMRPSSISSLDETHNILLRALPASNIDAYVLYKDRFNGID